MRDVLDLMEPEKMEEHIKEVKTRLSNGAVPKRLLEEYLTKLELHEAFFIITQAQIRLREEKYKK
jgi:hypothetical protein